MELINRNGILKLLVKVCDLLNKKNINYLVYGSIAKYLYTKDEIEINDIDLIVKESDFEKIITLLKTLEINPIKTEFTIHANSTVYLGNDNKPFDISFDSYENYFQKLDINLKSLERMYFRGIILKLMKKDDLDKIYSMEIV